MVEVAFVVEAFVEKKLVEVPAAAAKLTMVARPVLSTLNKDVVALAVEEAISNRREFVSPLFACMANFANGEVVPMPTLPEM